MPALPPSITTAWPFAMVSTGEFCRPQYHDSSPERPRCAHREPRTGGSVPYAVPNSGHGESLQVGVPRARCGVHELYYDGSDWMHNDLTAILLLVPGDLLSTQLGHPTGVDAQIKSEHDVQ